MYLFSVSVLKIIKWFGFCIGVNRVRIRLFWKKKKIDRLFWRQFRKSGSETKKKTNFFFSLLQKNNTPTRISIHKKEAWIGRSWSQRLNSKDTLIRSKGCDMYFLLCLLFLLQIILHAYLHNIFLLCDWTSLPLLKPFFPMETTAHALVHCLVATCLWKSSLIWASGNKLISPNFLENVQMLFDNEHGEVLEIWYDKNQ